MARTLDRTKNYGTICGPHEASFVQDGVFFDINGDEIGSEEPQETPKNKGGRPPKKVEDAPTDEIQKQIDANLAG